MSLALELAYRLSPSFFAESLNPNIKLDGWQQALLESDSKEHLVCCSRQAGKSLCAALAALHLAIFHEDSLILVVARAERQAKELVRTATWLCAGYADAGIRSSAATGLEVANGSRILALPGSESTIRCFSAVDAIILDEASRISADVYVTVTPMLATSNGRLIALSTPHGTAGWFYEAWTEGAGWSRTKVTCWQVPRLSRDFLERERQRMGAVKFSEEYKCEFLSVSAGLFNAVEVDAAFQDVPPSEVLEGKWRAVDNVPARVAGA